MTGRPRDSAGRHGAQASPPAVSPAAGGLAVTAEWRALITGALSQAAALAAEEIEAGHPGVTARAARVRGGFGIAAWQPGHRVIGPIAHVRASVKGWPAPRQAAAGDEPGDGATGEASAGEGTLREVRPQAVSMPAPGAAGTQERISEDEH